MKNSAGKTPQELLQSMSLEEKEYAYVMGMFEPLKGIGILEGGKYEITTFGDQFMAALLDSGFSISNERMMEIAAAIWFNAMEEECN